MDGLEMRGQRQEAVPMIKIKRIYESPGEKDGFRILVDRLWPRGWSKDKAKVHLWLRDISPSNELRKWYGHDPEKWAEFKKKYFQEIKQRKEEFDLLLEKAGRGNVTLLFSSQEKKLNNAAALKEIVERKLR
jgi:uncharacterized protein YeaO (DUF488 family)